MKLSVALIVIFIQSAIYSQSAWINSYTSSSGVSDMSFVHPLVGYAVTAGMGSIVKTTDGGESWIQQFYNGDISFGSVVAVGPDTAFVFGVDLNNGVEKFYKTIDGGSNWILQGIPLAGVSFFTTNSVGYLLHSQSVYKTTNGGLSWQSQGIGYLTKGVYFINNQTGFVLAENMIFRTSDAGGYWAPSVLSDVSTPVSVQFPDQNTGFVMCYKVNGNPPNTYVDIRIHKTTNAGQSWSLIFIGPYPPYDNSNSIFFINQNTGFFVTHDKIYKSTNGGAGWNLNYSAPYVYSMRKIKFVNALTGFTIGLTPTGGFILKTTTGGELSIQKVSSEIPINFSLFQNYPNPFNPSTNIEFQIADVGNGRDRSVNLVIYDALGRELETLVNENLSAGTYEVTWDAAKYSTGVYYYRITAGDYTDTKKMILIK